MRLRTLTGTRYPARCADGCGTVVPPSPDVRVVVDFESHPRKTWIPAHSPDAGTWRGNGSNGSANQPAPWNGESAHPPAFVPANTLAAPKPPAQAAPSSSTKTLEPPPSPKAPAAPAAVPLALLGAGPVLAGQGLPQNPSPSASRRVSGFFGSDAAHAEEEASPSPQAGRAWSSGGLTVNAGKFESVRAGYADYSLPGETAEQLGVRVNAVIEADLRAKLALLVRLHREFGIPGPEYLRPTSSVPTPAGAPKGAPVGASVTVSSSSPPLKALVQSIRVELADASPLRLMRKEKVWVDWLQKRGYTSLQDVRVGDEWGLGKVLDEFEGIDRRG